MEMNCIWSPRMDTALEQLCNPPFRFARPLLLRWQGYRENAELLLGRGQERMPVPSHRSGQSGTLGPHIACPSAGRLEPPVYGCHSGYQDAAEDLGDHEYGEDHRLRAHGMYQE